MKNRKIKKECPKPTPKDIIFESLTEIFKAVADYVDGGCYKKDIEEIVKAYEEAMNQAAVMKFYCDLVDERSAEVFGIIED